MKIVAVADTHAAIWYLQDDPRLSPSAKVVMVRAAEEGTKIAISSISLVEVVYLVEKGRVHPSAYADLLRAIADPEHVLAEVVLSAATVEAMLGVPRSEVPDMPDRIVAATGLQLGVPIISRDGRIRASSLQTIW